MAGMSIMVGPKWMHLDRCGLCGEHDANSQDDGKSKYVKHDQIVAVSDAVTMAPQQSSAQLRHYMQLASPLAESPCKNIAQDSA
jgi:hypothetical protein